MHTIRKENYGQLINSRMRRQMISQSICCKDCLQVTQEV